MLPSPGILSLSNISSISSATEGIRWPGNCENRPSRQKRLPHGALAGPGTQHDITDMANVLSILEHGILSHRLAARTAHGHVSVADTEVQARRARKRIWLGHSSRFVHDYANLYLDARNAMLFILLRAGQGNRTRAGNRPQRCWISRASSSPTGMQRASPGFPAVEGIAALDEATVSAQWWNDSADAKQRRMAEALVPDRVPSSLIRGAYVPDDQAATRLSGHLGRQFLPIQVHPWLFFRGKP